MCNPTVCPFISEINQCWFKVQNIYSWEKMLSNKKLTSFFPPKLSVHWLDTFGCIWVDSKTDMTATLKPDWHNGGLIPQTVCLIYNSISEGFKDTKMFFRATRCFWKTKPRFASAFPEGSEKPCSKPKDDNPQTETSKARYYSATVWWRE